MPASRRARGVTLAVAAVVAVGAVDLVALQYQGGSNPAPGSPRVARGTMFLQAASCANWRRWDAGNRASAVAALGVAATAPDPENAGATLDRGAAYSLFQRACSTPPSSHALLYEIYNRAASFSAARVGPLT